MDAEQLQTLPALAGNDYCFWAEGMGMWCQALLRTLICPPNCILAVLSQRGFLNWEIISAIRCLKWCVMFAILCCQVVLAALDKPRNIQSKGSIGDIVTDTGVLTEV